MVRVDQRMDLFFRLVLIFFRDRDDSVRNSVKVGDGLVVGVIRNDQRNVAGKFPALMTVEQIDEAVVVLRNQDDYARTMRGLRQPPVHLELFGDGREMPAAI